MIGPPAFALGLFLMGVGAVATAAALKLTGRAEFVLAALISAAGSIVAIFHVLSAFDRLDPELILVGQALLALGALGAWLVRGRPDPPGGWVCSTAELAGTARAHPALAVLTAVVTIALVIELVLGLLVAPNNWDAMSYHLSRAAYWLQYRSVGGFDGAGVRQLGAPPNGEMLQAWTMALWGTDRLAQIVQWVALLGLITAVFAGARALGFDRPAAVLAAALFASMPQPIMQASSAQNDLIVTFFVACAALFAATGLRRQSVTRLLVAAVALALAIGTKRVGLIALVPLAILLLPALGALGSSKRTRVAGIAVLLGLGVAVGSLSYALDTQATQALYEPLGSHLADVSALPANVTRVMWSFVDLPGIQVPLAEPAIEEVARAVAGGLEIAPQKDPLRWDPYAAEGFLLTVDRRVNEDTSAFGVIGLFVLLPLLLFVAFSRRSLPSHRLVAVAALAYIIVAAAVIPYHPWVARLLLPGVALGAPLLATVAQHRRLQAVVAAVAVLALIPLLAFNERKRLVPSGGQESVLTLNRLEQQTVARPGLRKVLERVERRLPEDAAVGFAGHEYSWDYPLFGNDPRRRLVRMNGFEVRSRLARGDLQAVFLSEVAPPRLGLPRRRLGPGYYLVFPRR